MDKQFDSGLMWFRRDPRVTDNAALCLALTACRRLHCVFVFDRDTLEALLRFGTVSIRQLVATALQRQIQGSRGAAVWLVELICPAVAMRSRTAEFSIL